MNLSQGVSFDHAYTKKAWDSLYVVAVSEADEMVCWNNVQNNFYNSHLDIMVRGLLRNTRDHKLSRSEPYKPVERGNSDYGLFPKHDGTGRLRGRDDIYRDICFL